MATRLRIGLVGAGRRGQAHIATMGDLSDLYEPIAVCDVDEPRAQAGAQRLGATAYTDITGLFSRARLDAVVIATPPETHHLVAKAAADARVPMLIETPLALTRAMMDLIAEVADKAGVPVEVGENYGRRPGERLARQAIEAGLVGDVVHLSAFNGPMNHESCYHVVSLLRLYAGADVDEVQALAERHRLGSPGGGGADSETWTDVVFRLTNGVTASGSFVSGWNLPPRSGRPRIVTTEGTAGYVVSGETENCRLHRVEGGASVDYPVKVETRVQADRQVPLRYFFESTPPVVFENPLADRALTDLDMYGPGDGLARARELMNLYRAVTEGASPEYGVADGRRSQEVGIAVTESGRLGRPLSARLGQETTWEREQHEAFRRQWGADPIKDVDLILARWRQI